jgi:hypothetical protein
LRIDLLLEVLLEGIVIAFMTAKVRTPFSLMAACHCTIALFFSAICVISSVASPILPSRHTPRPTITAISISKAMKPMARRTPILRFFIPSPLIELAAGGWSAVLRLLS